MAVANTPGLRFESGAARAVLNSSRSTCLISSLTINEFVKTLDVHYHLARTDIAELVRAIMAMRAVECARSAIEWALEHWIKHPELSFVDCLIAEEARMAGADRLWTFDAKLAGQHGIAETVLPAGEPPQGGDDAECSFL
ncbi:MAG: PIN domain-containing protein [Bifidobacteriaceae bacterium]|nr:PIN domain-containing protein [Bifidobacteriaceae bacterium]